MEGRKSTPSSTELRSDSA